MRLAWRLIVVRSASVRWIAGAALLAVASVAGATQPFKYQGFNMMAFSKGDYAESEYLDRALEYIVSRHSNLVVIDWNVAVDDDGSVLPQSSSRAFEPPREDLTRLVARARERGLKVFLKPHVGFPDNTFANRGEYNTDMTRFSMDRFFRDWTAYLGGLADMANTLGVDAIVIGTENLGWDRAYRADWLRMIATLRQGYRGKIAYDAHFTVDDPDRFTQVVFWDAVDIIGLSLYVALSKNDNATLGEVNEAWHSNPYGTFGDIPAFLKALSLRFNKPIMALEGGYQSITGGLYDVGPVDLGRPSNDAVQAVGIASYLDTLGKHQGDWFWGLSNWVAFPPFFNASNALLQGYLQGYMTNGKPAAEILRHYFSGETVYSDPVFTGREGGDTVFGSYASDWITAGTGDDVVWGGAGVDTIVAGPAVVAARTTAKVELAVTGDVLPGGGPRLRLLINSSPVSDWIEVTAPRVGAPQRIAINFPLGATIESFGIATLADPLFSTGVNRTVKVFAVSVNGSDLAETDATYAVGNLVIKGVGAWERLYSGTILTQDVSTRQTAFFGSPTDDDVIAGGEGNDQIDGGTGINAAVFSGNRADYTIAATGASYIVTDTVGSDGIDTLSSVSLLQFSDTVVDLRTAEDRRLPVVEYYNPALDHYFISWLPAERMNLALRKTATPWIATGFSFRAYATNIAGSSPVCRYYLPPQFGDSHFFGRGTAECAQTGLKNPAFVLEDAQFMFMKLPSEGACPLDTLPVYRMFSNRSDANHRYTTSRAVRDAMVAKGWAAEGDGADRVVLCAPR